MATIKILIVEDESIIAEDLKLQLGKLGYGVTGIAKSYEKALEMFGENQPDIMLVDIKLKGAKDGIDLVSTIREKSDIPVIFLTSHADKATVEKAKTVKPEGYLVKPFQTEDLYTAIEIAFSNYISNQTKIQASKVFDEDSSPVLKNSIFVKKDHLLIKIRFSELQWIKAERNYVELHCEDKMHLTRSTLKELLDKLPPNLFIQVHRSFAVNVEHITAIEYCVLFIGKIQIPLGRSFAEAIKNKLNITM
ncbi:MAG: response regulator [Bacteroidales bacterium]|nr:response regulator [Bacteroidales bacterium]